MADRQYDNIDPFEKGQRLSASQLNELVNALNKLRGVTPPQQQIDPVPYRVQQFKIVSIDYDFLTCNEWFGGVKGTRGKLQIKVAKPYLLRKTPFVSPEPDRSGIEYTYSGTQARTADNGDTEDQVVVPSYVVGDIIYACSPIVNGTGVLNGKITLDWIDCNFDGRAWAKVAE